MTLSADLSQGPGTNVGPTQSKGSVIGETVVPGAAVASDTELVERSQRGEREAYSLLVERYQDRIVNVCYRRVGHREDALDIAQDVFIKAYRAIGSYKGQSAFYTWLYRIAMNTSTTLWQRRVRRGGMVSLETGMGPARGDPDARGYEPADADGLTPEDEAMRSEDVQRVRDAIAKLEGNDHLLVTLRDLEGLSYGEIAETAGMPLGSVKSQLHRARARLKALIEDHG